MDNWDIDISIIGKLRIAFEKRVYKKRFINDQNYEVDVTTNNKVLDELYSHIKHNTWLEYFYTCSSNMGDNWIDFESEISKVIQTLGIARFQLECGGSIQNVESEDGKVLMGVLKAAKGNLKSSYRSVKEIDEFTNFLNTELERLIRALEIYIAEFINKIDVREKSTDIESLNPDHILSFNYSNTYERIYGKGKNINYDYIHGKADSNKNVANCNLVLGIDEYLDDNEKNKQLEFLTFKKYYQRIYKSTGNAYLNWVDEIKDDYSSYLKKQSDTYLGFVESFKDGSILNYPFQKENYVKSLNEKCPQHTLYVFGHSLDITDRDILKLFICNDNVQTKIFYYRENEDDKKVLGKLIKNLVKIMGQEELIRRTGGTHRTIEFVPQTIVKKN